MVIHQGDIYWVDLKYPRGSEPAYRRPMVVVQNDMFNHSALHTVIVAALTTNTARGAAPGNVTVRKGEANLPHRSVVNVTQVSTLDKSELMEFIGRLTNQRIEQILQGIALVIAPMP